MGVMMKEISEQTTQGLYNSNFKAARSAYTPHETSDE